jgi:hypothetical protein
MQPLKKYKYHEAQGFLQYGYFVKWARQSDFGANVYQTKQPKAYLKKTVNTNSPREVSLLIKYAHSNSLSEKGHLNIYEAFLKSQPVFHSKIIKP